MSDWTQWIEFIVREANEIYGDKQPDNPASWNVAIAGLGTGDIYANSPNLCYEFEKSALIALSNEAAGHETTIFMNPPKGYTIINGVDCGDLKVVQGKCKADGNHVIFATNAAVTSVVALVHVDNNNRGLTSTAIDAFAKAVEKAMAYGI